MRFWYRCSECKQELDLTPGTYVCPRCTGHQDPTQPIRGILDVVLSGSDADPADPLSFLPVPHGFFPSIPVGQTPLWQPENLRSELKLPGLFIKDDSLNPTGSLKDRASFLVAAFAREYGIREVSVASTGNAASSMAGVGAAAGLAVTIFIPAAAPEAKMVQSLQYGATVHLVDGSYDDAFDLSMAYAGQSNGINRNTGFNPLTIEGKKTVALEIAHQLGKPPDILYVPVGDGVILSGIYKGFQDLVDLGFAERVPHVVAVQSTGSAAIARAFREKRFGVPVPARTIADSISVDVPRNGFHALQNLEKHNGRCVTVSDNAILEAQQRLSASAGIFAEPAAATAFAGLLADRDNLDPDATVVVVSTGHGLKDIATARKGIQVPTHTIRGLEDL